MRTMFWAACLAATGWGGTAGIGRPAWAAPAPAPAARLPFVENAGQIADPAVRFAAQTPAGAVGVAASGDLVYVLPAGDAPPADPGAGRPVEPARRVPLGAAAVVAERWAGARPAAVRGGERAAATASFFLGADPARWRANVPAYVSVECVSLYPGIDLAVQARGATVEKIFRIAPGADPRAIAGVFEGATALRVDAAGDLVASTALGEARFSAPVAWQPGPGGRSDRVPIRYQVDGCRYGFKLGAYDAARPLVIDPLLAGTYLGGYRWDQAQTLAVDGRGRIYVAGFTGSLEFPTTPGAYQRTRRGTDAFVALFDPAMTNLLAATYLGGTHVQAAYALALDGAGRVCVAGSTSSSNFPTTPGAYRRALASGETSDVFVAILDAGLTRLLASTLLGGSEMDDGLALAVDRATNIYVAGVTRSADFPMAPGAFQPQLRGWGDGFVARLDSRLQSLQAATYLGGSNYDRINDVKLDAAGDVFVTGITGGNGFPVTAGAYRRVFGGGELDGFVAKLNPALGTLRLSTYLGGAGDDWPMAVIPSSQVQVAGFTYSSNFPTTPGAFQRTFAGGTNDGFLCSLDLGLSQVLAATFLGGSGYDFLEAMVRAPGGALWVTGYTGSPNFPRSARAYTRTLRQTDAFIARLDGLIGSVGAATLLGGSWDDYAHAIRLDPAGNPVVAGYTESFDFPISPGAVQPHYHQATVPHYGDGFVARLDTTLADFPAPPLGVTASDRRFADRVRVAWWSAAGAAGYTVWRSAAATPGTAAAVQTLAADATSWDDWQVAPGRSYWYWVTAHNAGGRSAFSAAARGVRSPVHPLAADFDGDGRDDPVAVSSGSWYVWLSSAGYRRVGPAVGSPAAWAAVGGDFDGDRLADPAAASDTGAWRFWFSRSGYRPAGPFALGIARAATLATDFDRDGVSDPTRAAGNAWHIWMSSAGFRPSTPLVLGTPDMIPLAADFDGDRYGDLAGILDGDWTFWLSGSFYERLGPVRFGLPDGIPVTGDFDGDRRADPAVYRAAAGAWYLWFSGAGYARGGPFLLHP